MNKVILFEYVRIFEQYNNNSTVSLSDEQRQLISFVNDEAFRNEEFGKFIEKLKESSNKDEMIENYFKTQEINNYGSSEDVIANTFGIDVSKIEHKYLENGKEIFKFYNDKLDKYIILENEKNGTSLTEQLKEIQSQNEEYQTNDNEKNSQAILEDKRFKENCELDMVPLKELDNHLNKIQALSSEDYMKLNFMINNSEILGITSINIENVIGLDKEGKIYEVSVDKLNNQFTIGEPNTANYREENIITSDRVDVKLNKNEQLNASVNSYEDKPIEIEYDNENSNAKFYDLPEHIRERAIMYYEFPDLLESLSIDEREVWKQYINMYEKVLEMEEREKSKEQEQQKVKRYIKEKKDNFGFVNLSVLSLIVGFVTFTLAIVIMIWC